MGMAYCRGCGKQLHDTASFCPHCGAPQATTGPAVEARTLHSVSIQSSNTIVWILAFAPIIGAILESMLAAALAPDSDFAGLAAEVALKAGTYWWITLLLNVLLSVLDDQRLKRAGVDTSTFGRLAFLVPVYLWKRAKALNQSPAYFWVWIVCFAAWNWL